MKYLTNFRSKYLELNVIDKPVFFLQEDGVDQIEMRHKIRDPTG